MSSSSSSGKSGSGRRARAVKMNADFNGSPPVSRNESTKSDLRARDDDKSQVRTRVSSDNKKGAATVITRREPAASQSSAGFQSKDAPHDDDDDDEASVNQLNKVSLTQAVAGVEVEVGVGTELGAATNLSSTSSGEADKERAASCCCCELRVERKVSSSTTSNPDAPTTFVSARENSNNCQSVVRVSAESLVKVVVAPESAHLLKVESSSSCHPVRVASSPAHCSCRRERAEASSSALSAPSATNQLSYTCESERQQQVNSRRSSDSSTANSNSEIEVNNFSSSNNSLFWKLLSNLPKSITQRSKSITSSSLTPEVAGYLASKQQAKQQQQLCKQRKEQQPHGCTSEGFQQRGSSAFSSYAPSQVTAQSVPAAAGEQREVGTAQSSQEKVLEAKEMINTKNSSVDLQDNSGRLIRIVAPQVSSSSASSACMPGGAADWIHQVTSSPQTGDTEQAALAVADHELTALNPAMQVQVQAQECATAKAAQGQVKLSIATTCTTSRSSASSLSSCMLSDSTSTSEVRLKWGKKMDFLLSIIGFAVDLANIWRFPYLVYKNGGGVFLIPYLIMLIFGGIPLFFLELCLGQFVKKGPITVWNRICPAMKGVGYCSILISWYVSFYYNVLIAWSVYFIYRSLLSFGEKMPWEDCDNSWNSKGTCVSISHLKNVCSTRNVSLETCRKDMFSSVNVTSPASEFFVKELSQIDQSAGLDDMGYLRIELVLCTMIVYLLHYFSLFRGLETSGKVVWVTATAPYMILSILLVRGLFLPGASMGVEYYLSPKLEKLLDPQVWIDASTQVFYSIGVGFGVHLTYASFNSHNNNCYRDCLMTSAVNAATSVYSGLVVFVYLGYMAKNLGIEIDKVASEGYSLVFEVYPEALTTLPFARFWSILFFIMLLTLGIDSAMGGLEAVITGLEDEFKFAKRLSRGQLTALVIVSSFIPALISCTQGGAYTLFWFDIYSAGISLLFSALFETIGVVYCYGLDKFIPNIESMLGRKPNIFYIICWKYISPIFLGGVIFMSLLMASVPTYRDYTFPLWSIILGWCLAFSSVSAIPIVALWHYYSNRGKASASFEKRKRDRGSSSATSSRKSPNHRSVLVSYGGKAPSGLTTTTTTVLTTPQ